MWIKGNLQRAKGLACSRCSFQRCEVSKTSCVWEEIERACSFVLVSEFHELRELYTLQNLSLFCRRICDESGFNEEEQTPMNIEYDTLLDLIEHLKAAADIASNRTKNWQAYCLKNQCKG